MPFCTCRFYNAFILHLCRYRRHGNNLENGKGNPSIPLFCKIMRALNMSADSYITPNNDQTDPDYQEMIQIFNQCDTYQRSVLLATGRALLKKNPI